MGKDKQFLQQNIIKTIDIYIGKCVEPKDIHSLDEILLPVDELQFYLYNPEIALDLNPNNINYNFIVDTMGIKEILARNVMGNDLKSDEIDIIDVGMSKNEFSEVFEFIQAFQKPYNTTGDLSLNHKTRKDQKCSR
ncbi:15992_t:CDS:2 [Dentiscutata heterogama]|uniref:15992_t:CDS:1 n=1 Tax=Dentiscutata heterogama TaxID=1316150 RepID=A0ACA9JV14_9GLOM|nr:15992_t:CDS:2 [Dentiscutata heterogama]